MTHIEHTIRKAGRGKEPLLVRIVARSAGIAHHEVDLRLPEDTGYVEIGDRPVGVLGLYRAGRQLIVTAFHVVPEARAMLAGPLRERLRLAAEGEGRTVVVALRNADAWAGDFLAPVAVPVEEIEGRPPDTTELAAAVQDLYEVFRGYEARLDDYCDHCIGEEDVRRLESKPLHHLDLDDLSTYLANALYTWGDADDYRHFLPRLLELLAFEPGGAVNPETITNKLAYAKWQEWPEHEQEAVDDFFVALWRHLLRCPRWGMLKTGSGDLGDWLCVIAQATDPARYVDIWLHEGTEIALREFVRFGVGEGWDALVKGAGNAFWTDEMRESLRAALGDPERHDAIRESVRDEAGVPEEMEELADLAVRLAKRLGGRA